MNDIIAKHTLSRKASYLLDYYAFCHLYYQIYIKMKWFNELSTKHAVVSH